MIFVERPEKLLVVIAYVGQMFFTRLQDLALLAAHLELGQQDLPGADEKAPVA